MEITCAASSSEILGLCGTTQLGLSQTFLPKETLSKWEHFQRMALMGLWAERGETWSLRDKGDPSSRPCPDLSRSPEPPHSTLTLDLQLGKETALISLTGHLFLNLMQFSFHILKGYSTPEDSNFATGLSSGSAMKKLSNY